MSKLFKIVFICAAFGFLFCSCGSKGNEKGMPAYKKSLNDSIAKYKQEMDSCNAQITTLRDKVGAWLPDFTTVMAPSGKGGYIIYTPAKDSYPLKSTGLVARVNTNGNFELIAGLESKKFDSITVTATGQSASSSTVPQGGSSSSEGIVSAVFIGDKAKAIGQLIADNELNPISVIFLNGSEEVAKIELNNESAKAISLTYLFFKDNNDMTLLEKKMAILNEKINLIRAHLEKLKGPENQNQ